MDVQRELDRAMHRVRRNVDAGIRDATERIEEPTPTEWFEISIGLRDHPEEVKRQRAVAAWEGFGAALYQVQSGMNDIFAALGRGWEQEKGKP